MLEEILDAFIDSIKIFPFILFIYVIMEVIENAKNKEKIEKALSNAGAPVFAGLVGIVPECGFAVGIAKLYEKNLIKIGTLIAGFIAVSDEGLIILLSNGKITDALIFIAVKVVYAILIGEILNFLFSKKDSEHICPNVGDCIECGKHQTSAVDRFLLHPLVHSVKTFLFVLVFNIIFAVIIYLIGREKLDAFLMSSEYYQPLFSALVGLIPNCASSTVIAQAYVGGILNFSGLLAGLSCNAGLGLVMLFKNKNNLLKNLTITVILFIFSVVLGYLSILFI